MSEQLNTIEPAQCQTAGRSDHLGFVLWLAVLAGAVLAGIRLLILSEGPEPVGLAEALLQSVQGLAQDLAVIVALALATVVILGGLSRWRRLAGLMLGIYVAAIVILLVWGLANMIALHLLGAPVTMEWLAYADITGSDVILDSLRQLFGWDRVLPGLALIGTVTGAAAWLARRSRRRWPGAILAGMAAITLVGQSLPQPAAGSVQARQANPAVAFFRSLGGDGGRGGLDALLGNTAGHPAFGPATPLDRPAPPARPIRNVVLFAFESTPAKQTQGWGGTHPVTPNLASRLDHALAFDRAYAHVPASNFYLVSVFGALVPEISTTLMTANRPDLDLVTLADVLGRAGLRTAFFNSSDNRFQNAEGFLRGAGFDRVSDYRDWTCETGVYEFESVTDRFLNTSNDLCTIDQITRWIDEAPDTPFFAAFRTGMTHYPYFPGEDPQVFVEDADYNNYLNALRVGDQAFGALMEHLDRKGLADETLVVVLGDHGEAFGDHGTFLHASAIYEENVRIPLALINPQLFSGTRSDLTVGIRDIAPTITDLLNIDRAPIWQGRSFFDSEREDGVLFFAPWNGFQVGFRSGDHKFIFNGNTGEEQLFDLVRDPDERVNIAATDPAALTEARDKIGRAIAAQNAYIDRVVGRAAPEQALPSEIVIELSGTRYLNPPKAWVTLDGEHVAVVEVTSAPSNAERAVTRDEIDAGRMTFRLPVQPKDCARQIGVYFLNDEWEGEGQTGDTDLFIRKVTFGDRIYLFNRITLLTPNAGHVDGAQYALSRKGEVRINLDMGVHCLNAGLREAGKAD